LAVDEPVATFAVEKYEKEKKLYSGSFSELQYSAESFSDIIIFLVVVYLFHVLIDNAYIM
jgi:hypothetical protein